MVGICTCRQIAAKRRTHSSNAFQVKPIHPVPFSPSSRAIPLSHSPQPSRTIFNLSFSLTAPVVESCNCDDVDHRHHNARQLSRVAPAMGPRLAEPALRHCRHGKVSKESPAIIAAHFYQILFSPVNLCADAGTLFRPTRG